MLIAEKYTLLDLLRRQYNLLKEINTPEIALLPKENEIQLVNKKIEKLKVKKPLELWEEFQKSTDLAIKMEIEDLTTGFVDSEWPNH